MDWLAVIKRPRILSGALTAFALLCALVLGTFDVFHSLELKTLDLRFAYRGPNSEVDSNIVIVAVDDQTFSSLPVRWPFPRTYYARVIENLVEAGARLVVFDIEFTEPSQTNPLEDDSLALAVLRHPNVILAGKVVLEYGRSGMVNSYALKPIPKLMAGNNPWGLVSVVEDDDGFIRRYLLFAEMQTETHFPLGLEALRFLYGGANDGEFQNEDEFVLLAGFQIPKYEYSTMLINFNGPAQTFKTYSFSNILDDERFDLIEEEDTDIFDFHREWGTFKDKIVFIGAAAEELQDNKFTPFYSYQDRRQKMPGVEVHANAFATVVSGNYILPSPAWLDVFLFIVLAFLIMVTVKRFKPLRGLMLTLGVAAIYVFIGFFAFKSYEIWMPIVTPLMVVAGTFVVNTVHQVMTEQREKARFRQTFKQYLAPGVVDTMLSSGVVPSYGGEKKMLSVLFSDVRSFTSYSERYPPEVVVSRLQEYLSDMVEVIFKHNGTLDKFVGDEIMAVYGAPYYFSDHAGRACRTALEMIASLREIQKRWSRDYKDYFQIGIGVNTGKMIVGNLGSTQLFDYTVIGDEVNLGARLEGTNKQYNTQIIISESTYNEVQEIALVRELDLVRVKGKSHPVKIYELRGMDWVPEIEQDLIIEAYSRGLAYYKDRKWYQAMKEFRRVLRYFPSDGPARLYTERCLSFIEQPPPDDWDGVYEFKTK